MLAGFGARPFMATPLSVNRTVWAMAKLEMAPVFGLMSSVKRCSRVS
jgi:hypothetical protein